MKNVVATPRAAGMSYSGSIARLMSGIGPQIMLAPLADGTPTPEETAAAEKAAADKAAADKAAADKAAAEKAEADRLAAEQTEKEKHMSDAEKEAAKLLREVMEKKNKLKETEAEKERIAAELKKFEGIDLEKVKTLLEAEKTREAEELEKKGEFDRLKKMIAEERDAEKKTFNEKIKELQEDNTRKAKTIDELTIGANFNGSEFIREDMVLTPAKARQLFGSHFEMKDGVIVAYDKPAGSPNRTIIPGPDGNPMPFDQAIKKIVDADPDKETLLRVKMNKGGGSSTQPLRKQPETQEDLHGASRIALALAKRQQK